MHRILIADDHAVVRMGVRTIIKTEYPAAQIVEAPNASVVLEKIKSEIFDLIILDINMPDTDGLELMSMLRVKTPETKVLAFSAHSEKIYAKRFFKLGAYGYLNKEVGEQEIRSAIVSVLNNKKYISEAMTQWILSEPNMDVLSNPFDLLSKRKMEVMRYLITGKGVSEIGQLLNISISTIGTFKTRIFDKLSVSNVIELSNLARLHGMLS